MDDAAIDAAWREMMAELAGRTVADPALLVANDGEALVRLSLLDAARVPLGIGRLVGDDATPLIGRGWIAPHGQDGATFLVTARARSA